MTTKHNGDDRLPAATSRRMCVLFGPRGDLETLQPRIEAAP